jgi:hypothetical protein
VKLFPVGIDHGIECRAGGGAGADTHQVVFSFASPVTFASATVTPGSGQSAHVAGTSTNGNDVIVNLDNVSNAQTLTVTLLGVTAGGGPGDISASMSVLVGDTNADRFVNSADISQTKSQSGQNVDNSEGANNFREDLNVDGLINSADITLVKSKSGTALP